MSINIHSITTDPLQKRYKHIIFWKFIFIFSDGVPCRFSALCFLVFCNRKYSFSCKKLNESPNSFWEYRCISYWNQCGMQRIRKTNFVSSVKYIHINLHTILLKIDLKEIYQAFSTLLRILRNEFQNHVHHTNTSKYAPIFLILFYHKWFLLSILFHVLSKFFTKRFHFSINSQIELKYLHIWKKKNDCCIYMHNGQKIRPLFI